MSKEVNADKTNEITVHTEKEMRDFALSSLGEKYGKEFVIDETYCKYGRVSRRDKTEKMEFRARAYPVDEPDKYCGILVTEPDSFKDNYFARLYESGVGELIYPEMEKYGVKTNIHIYRSASTQAYDDKITADEFLHQKETTIELFVPVEEEKEISKYVPAVQKWLPFLFSCDYDWYFVLHDKNDRNKRYFNLMKGDKGIESADEWTEDKIIEGIEKALRFNQ